jgi:predicted nucleic acid-binding protein
MRVVLDTNILVSALLVQMGHPAVIYRAWQQGHFTLLTCAERYAAQAYDCRAD